MADRSDRSRPDPEHKPARKANQRLPPDLPDFLVVGQVVRPHGIRGDLLVESSSETFRAIQPGGVLYLGSAEEPQQVVSLRAHQGRHIVHLEGYEDREAAEALRGKKVRIALESAEPLPEGVYYRWQILGLNVVDEAGEGIGAIAEIIETGANDVYVVQRDGRKELLLPAIESVILEVDLLAGQVTVVVPEGLESSS